MKYVLFKKYIPLKNIKSSFFPFTLKIMLNKVNI